MSDKKGKDEQIDRFMKMAHERWGDEEYEQLKPALEKTAEAIHEVEEYNLEPDDEPTRSPGKR